MDELASQTKLSFQTAIDKLISWADAFIGHIPNMAVAILILVAFSIMARIAQGWVNRIFDPTRNDVIRNLSINVVYYTVLGLGIFIVLEVLSLRTAVTSLLAGLGIVGIALGFAFQDIAANFLSGIILAYRKPFQLLDIVQMGEYIGTITQINVRDTVLKTFQGQEVVIPNRSVIQNPIINYTSLGERRVDLTFRAAYTENLEQVKKITENALKPIEQIVRKNEINFIYTDFEHSAIHFEIRFWVKYAAENDYINNRTLAIMAIKKALDTEGISIPFTTRINRTMVMDDGSINENTINNL